jgi:phosphoglycerol transferase MdoB-like AlkP superfamily enzyme
MLHTLHDPQRAQQGTLLMHPTGGGTWQSEFAVMSGFDWRVFGRGGAYARVSLAPQLQDPLPQRLHELGYRTIAVIPTDGNFLSAKSAYKYYGFDEFYAAPDLHLPNNWQQLYDHLIFDKALRLAARDNDLRPVFVKATCLFPPSSTAPNRNSASGLPTT